MTKTTAAHRDRSRINTSEDYEFDYWTAKFGVSRDELRNAVDQVGSSADAVEEYLKNNR
ncbi:DUF3606 domain-containing protein [Flavobacterium sp. J372]|uniref:DUF3606 domain-containing protein n=1 Tax=Flavobacterium sp. J372 TaxID=2898436 RepID=UPI00215153F6|nr:DUF3606 domain-containing protein [Flavobacterium sp. J372]MCR5861821.1 DUF3606 domain-containing protein [Flavobacterium sp. J372]